MIKAVFFDLDNTLYGEKKAHRIALERVSQVVSRELNIDGETWKALCAGEMARMKERLGANAAIHNRMIRFLRVLENQGKPLRYAKQLNDLYWNTLVAEAQPEPGVRDCLKELKKMGLLTAVGTNMTLDWQLEKLSSLDLLEEFRLVISSEEAGCEKPEKAFFLYCAEQAGLLPQEILFVGDSLEGDVLGAEKAGMRALWYSPDRTDFSLHEGFSHFDQLQKHVLMV